MSGHLRHALDEGEQARIVADSSLAELEKLRSARAQLLHENRSLYAEINEKYGSQLMCNVVFAFNYPTSFSYQCIYIYIRQPVLRNIPQES